MALKLASHEEPIEDRYGKAIFYMEKLFPYYQGRFDIHNAIKVSNLPDSEKKIARRLAQDIDQIMTHEEGYADLYPDANCWRKLTRKGKSFQEEVTQKLLFDMLKQSPNYTIPWTKEMRGFEGAMNTFIDKEIIIRKEFPTYFQIRLNSDVVMANNHKEAFKIVEKQNTIQTTTINNYHQTTHGNNSPISGRDTIINEPDEEQKLIAKQGLFWTIIGVIVAIIAIVISKV